MNLTHKILGIGIEEVTVEILNNFFSINQEESDIFELKSFYENNQSNYRIKEDAILKSICAFLNSSGGLLIWGAPIGSVSEAGQEKTFSGALSPVEVNLQKDAFISKITNRLIPTPFGIKFKKVEIETGKYIYLTDVTQSGF